MIIGACTIELYLPATFSLKEKRSQIKPLLHQLRKRFEVAAAEVGNQEVWQSATLAIVTVSNDTRQVYSVLEHAARWLEENAPAQVMDWQIELR